MSEKIKIGQLGIGHNHARAYMSACRKLSDLYEVVGYSESDEEWIKKRGGLPAYEGLPRLSEEELLDKCDAVLVETDVWNLTSAGQRCLDAGKHIHLDKPASGTLAEYKKLLDTAERKNLIVQLGYMYRYNFAFKYLQQLIAEGKIGDIYSINAEMSTGHDAVFREWLRHFEGGTMYIFGSHLLDLVLLLLGEPKKVTSYLEKSGKDGIEVVDNSLAVLEYERALARIYISSVEINGYGRRQLVVSGSKGTLDIRPLENPTHATFSDLTIADKPHADRHVTVDDSLINDSSKERYDDMMIDFAAFIRGEKTNPYTFEHEYMLQRVLYEIIGKK